MGNPLDLTTIKELLGEPARPRKYPIPEQVGPLHFIDQELRCASLRCTSPTWLRLQGIPYCSMHALRLMNEMLVRKGVLS